MTKFCKKNPFFYSCEDEEKLNHGGFATFEEAKRHALQFHKGFDWSEFKEPAKVVEICEMTTPSEHYAERIDDLAEEIEENLLDSLACSMCAEEYPVEFGEEGKEIIKEMLVKLGEVAGWNYDATIKECKTLAIEELAIQND